MGNPSTETTQPAESNHHGVATLALLSLTDQVVTMGQQQAVIDAAGVRAQLAVAYELNTIARILAYTGEIIAPADSALLDTPAAVVQHNTIIERLGL